MKEAMQILLVKVSVLEMMVVLVMGMAMIAWGCRWRSVAITTM